MAQQTESAASELELAKNVIAENRTWFMILGICLIVLGFLAVVFPFMTTVAAKIFLGWLFLIGGIVQVFHAFSTKKWSAFFVNLLLGVLYVVAGGWLAFLPLTGIVTLTVLLSALFIAEGVLEAILAFRMRPHEGWIWVLVAGLIALAVGVMIFVQLPSSAIWAIGLLVGINLLSSGWAFLFMALSAKNGA